MLSKATILYNFQKAKRQADDLEQLANRLEKLANNSLGDTMQDISYSWKGKSANQYIKKGGELQSKMRKTAKELRATANDIRSSSRRMYDAEMRAVQIAQTRSSGGGGGGFR